MFIALVKRDEMRILRNGIMTTTETADADDDENGHY
jgi:hypothetical protein